MPYNNLLSCMYMGSPRHRTRECSAVRNSGVGWSVVRNSGVCQSAVCYSVVGCSAV